MSHNTIPRLDDQLCFALHAASRAMTRSYRPMLNALGITYTQFITLMVLWETDGLSVRDLGQKLRLDSGTLTPLLKRLERDQLVTRQRDPEDERRVRVHLTQQGHDLSQEASTLHNKLTCKVAEHTTDLAKLRTTLLELVDTLDQL